MSVRDPAVASCTIAPRSSEPASRYVVPGVPAAPERAGSRVSRLFAQMPSPSGHARSRASTTTRAIPSRRPSRPRRRGPAGATGVRAPAGRAAAGRPPWAGRAATGRAGRAPWAARPEPPGGMTGGGVRGAERGAGRWTRGGGGGGVGRPTTTASSDRDGLGRGSGVKLGGRSATVSRRLP